MKHSSFLTIILLIFFAMSCASTHPGSEGKSIYQHLPLTISAKTIGNPQNDAFQLVEVTIENISDQWVRLSSAKVIIQNPAESKLSVVVGSDLKDWAQAMEHRLAKDEHNKAMLMAGIATAGAVASAAGNSSSNQSLAAVGEMAILGTYAWAVVDVLSNVLRSVEGVEAVPENHLHKAFSVPPKMFTRKWVLFNKPSSLVLGSLAISLETVEGVKDAYQISF